MRLIKALKELGLSRTSGEAQRLIKQGAILVGGCIPPCNGRMHPYKCICGGWKKITDPLADIPTGQVVRIGSGLYRTLPQLENGAKFDQLPGIGWIPEENKEIKCQDQLNTSDLPRMRLTTLTNVQSQGRQS